MSKYLTVLNAEDGTYRQEFDTWAAACDYVREQMDLPSDAIIMPDHGYTDDLCREIYITEPGYSAW